VGPTEEAVWARLVAYLLSDRAVADVGLVLQGGASHHPAERSQRSIRSSGKLIKTVGYAQGWQGVESVL